MAQMVLSYLRVSQSRGTVGKRFFLPIRPCLVSDSKDETIYIFSYPCLNDLCREFPF